METPLIGLEIVRKLKIILLQYNVYIVQFLRQRGLVQISLTITTCEFSVCIISHFLP